MRVIEQGIIFDSQTQEPRSRVACFPGLVRVSDGRILCTFRVGTSKDSADETIRMAESRDEGKSWQMMSFAPDTSLNGTPGSLRIAHVIETKPGHLLFVINWINREDPDAPIAHPKTSGCLPMKLLAFRSTDAGRTWSEAKEITSIPFPQPELSGPVIALKEAGHILISMENQKHYLDTGPIDEKAYALLSTDYGETWPEWAMVVHDPARSYWCNRMALLPESGRLVNFSWTYDMEAQQDLPIHVSYGSPDGKQWSQPESSGVFGQLSTPFPLDEETVLMGYVHRHPPASIRLRASRDGGLSWNDDSEIVVHDGERDAPTDGFGGDIQNYYDFMVNYTFGWNPMVCLQNGNVLMAFFAGDPEAMDIRCATIDVGDLTSRA